MEMGLKRLLSKYESAISMLLVQLIASGVFLLSKITLEKGAFVFSLLTYRLIVAAIFLLPFAYFRERNLVRKLSWRALVWIFVTGLLGTAMMSLYYYGLEATSASYAANFTNLVPGATFVLSTVLGVEKLELKTQHGRLKLGGAILGFLGAVVIGLYKGNSLHISILKTKNDNHFISLGKRTRSEIARGSLFLAGFCLCSAGWFITQVKLCNVHPSSYWTTMLWCLAASIQSAVIGIPMDKRKSSWTLGWNFQLLTISYSAVLSTGATFCLIARTVTKRGPIYPSMFNPLALIFVTIVESLFMGEVIYVGSILGMLLIIGGFYIFLWGKRKESSASTIRSQESGEEGTASIFEPHQSNVEIRDESEL